NYDRLESSERTALVTTFAAPNRRTRLLLISGARSRQDLGALFGNHAVTNLIANNGQVDAEDLIVTAQKILRRDLFGIEKYFIWGVHVTPTSLNRSTEKARILAEAETYTKDIGIRSRLASLFCTVADELVTNALYNAPRTADGASRYAHLPRADEVVLDEH